MKSFSITDVGMKRSINQDYVYCNENFIGSLPNLFIVADGMGGHKAGDYASRLCVEEVVKSIQNSSLRTPIGIIGEAINKANKKVCEVSLNNQDYEGMGTTLVITTIVDKCLYVANIGDSRMYLIRNGIIKQITIDHSFVEEMVRLGKIRKEDARTHPKKNVIMKAIGTEKQIVPDYFEIDLKKDDIILLCSDGLSNMLEDIEIKDIILNTKGVDNAGKMLVNKANENGGRDNIAVILLKFDEEVKK